MLLERIEGNAMPGVASFESVRFSLAFLAIDLRDASGAGDALRRNPETATIHDETADCTDLRTRQFLLLAELQKQRMYLFLAEIGMLVSESFDLLDGPGIPQAFAHHRGPPRAGIEALEPSSTRCEFLLPLEQRPPLYAVCVHRCR